MNECTTTGWDLLLILLLNPVSLVIIGFFAAMIISEFKE